MNPKLANAALDLVGTPFRLHGRDPATGLDCVGLVGAALERCGRTVAAPAGYSIRLLDVGQFLGFAKVNDLIAVAGHGDVVLAEVHHLQVHLLVTAPGGFVHAHAGLGRVTFLPGPLPWTVRQQWQLLDSKD